MIRPPERFQQPPARQGALAALCRCLCPCAPKPTARDVWLTVDASRKGHSHESYHAAVADNRAAGAIETAASLTALHAPTTQSQSSRSSALQQLEEARTIEVERKRAADVGRRTADTGAALESERHRTRARSEQERHMTRWERRALPSGGGEPGGTGRMFSPTASSAVQLTASSRARRPGEDSGWQGVTTYLIPPYPSTLAHTHAHTHPGTHSRPVPATLNLSRTQTSHTSPHISPPTSHLTTPRCASRRDSARLERSECAMDPAKFGLEPTWICC